MVHTRATVPVVVDALGPVSTLDHSYSRDAVAQACERAPVFVIGARVELVSHPAGGALPMAASAAVELDGRLLIASAEGRTIREAVDGVVTELDDLLGTRAGSEGDGRA